MENPSDPSNPTNDIYYQKYLKYKAKYLELKKQLGGGCAKKCPKSINNTHKFKKLSGKKKGYERCELCGCERLY